MPALIIVRCIFIHAVGRPVFGAKARPSNQRYHWSLYLKKPMESVTSSVEFLSQLRLASTEPGNLTCQHFFHPSVRDIRLPIFAHVSFHILRFSSLSCRIERGGSEESEASLYFNANQHHDLRFLWKFEQKKKRRRKSRIKFKYWQRVGFIPFGVNNDVG